MSCVSSIQCLVLYVSLIVDMDLVYLKIVLLLNGWVFAKGSSVAMLQHATSSQSIVFHNTPSDSSTTGPNLSPGDRYGTRKPKYEYKYEVSDQLTGDRKSHWESREGDIVRGVYTLYEPDGALRTVEYTADAVHGFNAVVKRDEPKKHQLPGRSTYPHSSNEPNGYDTSSGQKADRDIFSSGHATHDGEQNYSGSKSLFNSGVDFSVNHVLKKFRTNENLY